MDKHTQKYIALVVSIMADQIDFGIEGEDDYFLVPELCSSCGHKGTLEVCGSDKDHSSDYVRCISCNVETDLDSFSA